MSRFAPRRLRALLALLFVTALVTGEASAQSGQCQALDTDLLPRDCTFLEEFGGCLWYAIESYFDCLDRAEDEVRSSRFLWALHSTKCQIELAIDQSMCAVTSPLRTILK